MDELDLKCIEKTGFSLDALVLRSQANELQVQQTQALATIATAFNQIAEFLAGGGLATILQGHAKSNAVSSILGGLASADGRKSLDARTISQNALEIAKTVEKTHDEYERQLQEKSRHDPEIKIVVEEDPGNHYFNEEGQEVDKSGKIIPDGMVLKK